jgi:Na+-driven multidrug efflux pump
VHFCSRRSVLKLHARNLRPRWDTLRPVMAVGMAPFAMHVVASAVSLIMNRGLAKYGGDTAIGAYGVISAFALFLLMPIFGLSQGAQPIIGYNYGAQRFDRVRQTLKLATIAATVVTVGGFALAQLIPHQIMGAFAPDKDLVSVGARGMRLCFLTFPVVGFGVIGAGFFQATGKAKTALVLTLLRQVILLIPMLFILPPYLGLDGMWSAGPVADLISSLLTAAALTRAVRELSSRAASPPAGAAEEPEAAEA